MLIQPNQPVHVTLKSGENQFESEMQSLSEVELVIRCHDYLEKGCKVRFAAKFFRGQATIFGINFNQLQFTYTLKIDEIQFQPGLLINTSL